MSKPAQGVPVISYALSFFYAASFFYYLRMLIVPSSAWPVRIILVLFLILCFCTLGVAKFKETARRNLVIFNIILWIYSLILLKIQPGLMPFSYILMNMVIALYFSQPSVKSQFLLSGSGGRKSILVVDDDEGLLKTVQRILLSNGFSVLTAASGEKGMQIAKLQKPDLIILDVILPGIKGRDLCQQLKDDSETRKIPVIFLTAKDSPDDVKAEMEAGGISHLTKPVSSHHLLTEIRKILGD